MDERSHGPSRRSFLVRGLVVAAGALGLGAGSAAGAEAAPSEQTLTLHGRFFHLHGQDRRAGAAPVKGERLTGYGELHDRPDGKKVGEFFSTLVALDSPFAATGPNRLEYHSFNLQDGTILGLGTAVAAGPSVFAIVGGTGRYAGTRGSYVADQHPRELGGNGTADFRLSLVA
jgi:hypothetical protein